MSYQLNKTWEKIETNTEDICASAYLTPPYDTPSVGTSYTRVLGTFVNKCFSGFELDGSDRLLYNPDDGVTRTLKLDWSGVVSVNTTGNTIYVAIEKNGTPIGGSTGQAFAKVSGEDYVLGAVTSVELAPNDYIEIVIKLATGTYTVTVSELSTTLSKIN